jgi:hypothetical protein
MKDLTNEQLMNLLNNAKRMLAFGDVFTEREQTALLADINDAIMVLRERGILYTFGMF